MAPQNQPVQILSPAADVPVSSNFAASVHVNWAIVQQVRAILQQNAATPVGTTFPNGGITQNATDSDTFNINFNGAPAGTWFLKVTDTQNAGNSDMVQITVQG